MCHVYAQMILQPHLSLTHTDTAKGCAATAETGNIKVTIELVCLHMWQCGNCAVLHRIMKYDIFSILSFILHEVT